MVDLQSYIYSLRYIALAIVIFYYVLVLFGKKLQPKALFSRKSLYVIGALLLVYFIIFKYQRYQIRESLCTLISMVDYNKTVDERLANSNRPDSIVFELNQQYGHLEQLKDKNALITKVLGRSESTDTLINQMQRFLKAQIIRVSNMSARSKEEYTVESFEDSRDEMNLIRPVFSGNSYVNVGVVIDEEATFKKENSLLVRIVRTDTDSILYQQSYVPKSGANSFVLPNYFSDDMVQLQIGYVNKSERKTYHYISCIPYGRE